MSDRNWSLVDVLTARAPLALFAVLTAGWFLPGLLGPYAAAALPLYLPAYLVSMVTYDGLLGLEQVVDVLQNGLGIESAALWDAGLIATFALFSVSAALLSRPLERRFGPQTGREGTTEWQPTIRYTVVAGLLLVGLLLVVQGAVAQPTMTSTTCTGSASAAEGGATASTECTTSTAPATGAQLHIVGLGTVVGLLGAGVVAADRWLVARS